MEERDQYEWRHQDEHRLETHGGGATRDDDGACHRRRGASKRRLHNVRTPSIDCNILEGIVVRVGRWTPPAAPKWMSAKAL